MARLREKFPEPFEFGTATSSYQIEGHGFGKAGSTHWDDFAMVPGNVRNGANGLIACDHYGRFKEDLDLVKDCGFDSYRFSTSWARVMPEGRGHVNQEGLDFYDRLIDATLERGLKPYITLYHWELPSALSDLGGWRNRDIAFWFADFVEVVQSRLGDRVHSVATINEPWCVSFLSHFLGEHAPGIRDIRATARAMHHVLLAHGSAVERLRDLGHDNIGCVFNLEYTKPFDETITARLAATIYDAIYNKFFLQGVFKKSYPLDIIPKLKYYLPKGWETDFEIIGQPLDWCGINYYTRKLIAPKEGLWPNIKEIEGPLTKTDMGWEIYPKGLCELLKWVESEYTKGLPIYVTENGMANADQIGHEAFKDENRINYFDQHLDQVKTAICDGVSVLGYFAWSLLDNFEWSYGYEQRFGLVHVDYQSQKRTPKSSYYWWRDNLVK